MKCWRWVMPWLRRSDERNRDASERLRQAEEHESRAMDRMVRAGIQATLRADDSSEATGQITGRLERRRIEGEEILRTADGVLRLLERDGRR
jgi:hypothetical protein